MRIKRGYKTSQTNSKQAFYQEMTQIYMEHLFFVKNVACQIVIFFLVCGCLDVIQLVLEILGYILVWW